MLPRYTGLLLNSAGSEQYHEQQTENIDYEHTYDINIYKRYQGE